MQRAALCLLTMIAVSGSIPGPIAYAQEMPRPLLQAPLTLRLDAPADRPTLFRGRDLMPIGLSLLGTALIVPLDKRITAELNRDQLQENTRLRETSKVFAKTGDPGILATSMALYLTGQATRKQGLADAGLHAMEALGGAAIARETLKFLVGRARPNAVSDTNPLVLRPFHGYEKGYSSFPSGHTGNAFAAATVFSRELRMSHPNVAKVATPLLYAAAGLMGASRVYENRHWASDVVLSAAIGTMVGNRVVTYAHGNPGSFLNWSIRAK